MKVKYVGESFGLDGLTNGNTYTVLGIEFGNLRVIDDSGEDYLYSASNPAPMEKDSPGGRWEIVEDENGALEKAMNAILKTA